MVDAHTLTLGLIGDPVDHSLSPRLHGHLLRALGVNGCYHAFRVPRAELAAAVAGLKALGIRGVNVTIPHKEAILPLLDKLSEEARAVGAVNVVANEQGRLVGYNTDVCGVELALKRHGVDAAGAHAVILGAGGAARAAVWALMKMNAATVRIHSRSTERREKLAAELANGSRTTALVPAPWEDAALAESLATATLLVNATPCGMWPNQQESPVRAELLRKGLVVFDLVYNPLRTVLVQEGAQAGAHVIAGLDMLIFQAMEAMVIWTGRRAPDADHLIEQLSVALSEELAQNG
ncbi:MAG: shikimate dehydrogenase [Candidatus Oleimicrobiaceae bacterium]